MEEALDLRASADEATVLSANCNIEGCMQAGPYAAEVNKRRKAAHAIAALATSWLCTIFRACMYEMLLLVEVGQLARNYNGLGKPLAAVVR